MPPTSRQRADADTPPAVVGDPAAQPDGDAAAMAASPENPGQEPDSGPAEIVATPTEEELAGALDLQPGVTIQDPDDEAVDDRVKLVPSDWQTDAVQFPYGDRGESLTIPRHTPYLVSPDEAAELIAAAGSAGIAITKEPVA